MPAGNRVRIALDTAAVRRVALEAVQPSVERAALLARARARNNITSKGRVNTGHMRQNITVNITTKGNIAVARVTAEQPYSAFQEYGTRAHGPKTAKVLRFRPKGQNTFVLAKHVRGVTPAYFMRDALRSVKIDDFFK